MNIWGFLSNSEGYLEIKLTPQSQREYSDICRLFKIKCIHRIYPPPSQFFWRIVVWRPISPIHLFAHSSSFAKFNNTESSSRKKLISKENEAENQMEMSRSAPSATRRSQMTAVDVCLFHLITAESPQFSLPPQAVCHLGCRCRCAGGCLSVLLPHHPWQPTQRGLILR